MFYRGCSNNLNLIKKNNIAFKWKSIYYFKDSIIVKLSKIKLYSLINI